MYTNPSACLFFLLSSRFWNIALVFKRPKSPLTQCNTFQYLHNIHDDLAEVVLAKQLKIGQIVLVKTGDTIPVDGMISKETVTLKNQC